MFSFVGQRINIIELEHKDPAFTDLALFLKEALRTNGNLIGYYNYQGHLNVASMDTMKSTQWKIIITAPKEELF
ncbi:hypothetical protein E4N71_10110 [Treponema vincentii]|uniref:hypothetical protein n=1 Tax=Treponema vincentii TaxID=69710 RepID=UPI0020A3FCDF|nr:hypothetical protein [Treponema vincentii]UTC49171.1 hypothetical protein E4N73_10145 [Treponema vincentii]